MSIVLISNSSPLGWAFASRKIEIARLLHRKGAQVDHVSARGWTAAFYLFGYEWIHGKQGASCIEYLEFLSAASFSDFDVQDVEGWSVMHRAAVWGTAKDIMALVDVGASMKLLTSMDWLPIRCAVRFGNVDTFEELLRHLEKSTVNQRDKRGWTILHDAAEVGNSTILELLLRNAADPHVVSFDLSTGVPKDLKNRILTPGEIARQKGERFYQAYANALRKVDFDISIVQELEESGSEDMFWPAESQAV